MTVIHRFMAVHSNIGQNAVDVPEMHLETMTTAFKRRRHASEHSEPYSDASEGFGGGGKMPISLYPTTKRKAPVRSMTEVRPSLAGDHFFTLETIRALRESREPSPLTGIETGDSKRSSIVVEEGDEMYNEGISTKIETHLRECEHSLERNFYAQPKTPERQKTSFSLNDEDVTLTENTVRLSESGLRLTSGSLGCLSVSGVVADPEHHPGIGDRRPSRGLSETHSSHGDAPRTVTWAEPRIKVIPPATSRSALMAMHTEYTRYDRMYVFRRM